jgi:prolyl-tRNA editing enzyme YbaK/EbsC (Cys-tRNA(Pro) deacylase)
VEYHKVTEEIQDLLARNHCWFETFEHVPVKTSEEAAKLRHGYSLRQGAKALIVRVKRSKKDKEFVMIVLSGDLKFDNDKVRKLFGAKDVRFATEGEISALTGGVQVGAVPPFGNLFNLKVFVDPKLLKNKRIVFNAGDRRFSIAMRSEDYRKLVGPQVVDIT